MNQWTLKGSSDVTSQNTFYAFYLSYSRLTILNIIWNLQVFASSGQFFGEHSSLVAGSKPCKLRFICNEIEGFSESQYINSQVAFSHVTVFSSPLGTATCEV